MTALPNLEVFTKRETAKIEATLRLNTRVVAVAVVPFEGETVAQFTARVMETHCGSIAQTKNAVIELRVVAEGEG